MVACLFAFAIYLKSGLSYAGISSTSQTRMWADPNQKAEAHTKFAPVNLVSLQYSVVRLTVTDQAHSYIKLPDPACKEVFFRSTHRFRPPPFA
jgi:glycerol-3-phosphate O-acyltransferase